MTCGALLLGTNIVTNMAINDNGRQIALCMAFEAVCQNAYCTKAARIPIGSILVFCGEFFKSQFGFWVRSLHLSVKSIVEKVRILGQSGFSINIYISSIS